MIIDSTHVFFSKIGKIRMLQHIKIDGKIKQATVKKDKANRYFATFTAALSSRSIVKPQLLQW